MLPVPLVPDGRTIAPTRSWISQTKGTEIIMPDNGMVEYRWTNGGARLTTSLLDRADQLTLELRLLWAGSSWTAPEQQHEIEYLRACA